MRHHEHGEAALGVQATQQGEDLVGGPRVEVAGRLVGEQQGGPRHQRPDDGHPLLLAARERHRGAVGQRAQAHGLEQRHGLGHQRRGRPTLARQPRHHHVLERREGRQQVVELEDEADGLAAQPRAGLVVERAGWLAEQFDLALGGRIELAQQVQQGRLARTRRANECGELAAAQLEAEAVQHLDLAGQADVVALANAVEAQDELIRHASPPRGRVAPRVAPGPWPRACPPPWPSPRHRRTASA